MKIGIQTSGTNGDIWPFLQLSAGLSKAGHDVTFVVTSMYRSNYSIYAEKYKIKIIETSDECCYQYSDRFKNLNSDEIDDYFNRLDSKKCNASEELCKNNNIVIGNQGAYYLHVFAEKEDIPYVTISTNHSLIPTKFRPFWLYGLSNLGEENNNNSWTEVENDINNKYSEYVNEYREKFGLKPLKNLFRQVTHSEVLHLVSVSKAFCEQHPDWENQRYVCGYFFPEEEINTMPEQLIKFIETGSAPLMFTIGSSSHNTENIVEIMNFAIRAAKIENKKIIIQTVSNEINISDLEITPDVFILNSFIDYRKIFPFCSLIIHHGGAGTTHYATLGGTPSVIIPDDCDMPFWGALLNSLGIAPSPIPIQEVNFENLHERIQTVLSNPKFKDNAMIAKGIMKTETPVEIAVNAIEQRFPHLVEK